MNKIKLYKILPLIFVITILIVPTLARGITSSSTPPIKSLEEVETVMENILDWVNAMFWIMSAIFILLAAFKYLTAQGDEEKIKKAKNMLVYAVIAVAIALFAGGIGTLVNSVITTGI